MKTKPLTEILKEAAKDTILPAGVFWFYTNQKSGFAETFDYRLYGDTLLFSMSFLLLDSIYRAVKEPYKSEITKYIKPKFKLIKGEK